MNNITAGFSADLAAVDLYRPVPVKDLSDSARSLPKRMFDIAISFIGLIFLAPLLIAISIVIKLTGPGPVVFSQLRTGLGGRTFVIYKFRTMSTLENGNRIVQACRGDNRVTRVGSFLRRSSLDELPQLWNVLIGDMSIVGPRPHAVAHDQYYGALLPDYRDRFRAKPGITGLAQCNGARGPTETLDKMSRRIRLDLAYIERWSLAMEARILVKTVKVILAGDACAF
jgi:lipopolysaccharide/colanic/teichoic acid biosynthesis glycosyltransferase